MNAHRYPAMSHPSADPAVNVVAARMAGHRAADPSCARVLEIGCASGHHLLPLAARWPRATFVGVDRELPAIEAGRELADEAELPNVRFVHSSIEGMRPAPGDEYDVIIAHGVFSWVDDAAKAALMRVLATCLAPGGVAVVSFNVAAGWRERLPVVAKVRAIMEAGAKDVVEALAVLRDVCETDAERMIVDDMLAKGAAVLAHDDFAPVNTPWSLPDVVAFAARHGLRWLGEGVPADNLPNPRHLAADPRLQDPGGGFLARQHAFDEAGGRTFRSAIFCQADAVIEEKVSSAVVVDFHLSAGGFPPDDAEAAALAREIARHSPADAPAAELIGRFGAPCAAIIARGIVHGWIAARTHPAQVMREAPPWPRLDALRLACARRGLPLVDARHRPCVFPAGQHPLLALLDGSRTRQQILTEAAEKHPRFDIVRWLDHLANRGLLCAAHGGR